MLYVWRRPSDLVSGRKIFVKIINDQIIIIFDDDRPHYKKANDPVGEIHEYLGNAYSTIKNQCITSLNDFTMCGTTYQIQIQDIYRIYFILPCGLAYLHRIGDDGAIMACLYDFVAKKQIKVDPVPNFMSRIIVDDFGTSATYPYDSDELYLTQYSPTLMQFNLV